MNETGVHSLHLHRNSCVREECAADCPRRGRPHGADGRCACDDCRDLRYQQSKAVIWSLLARASTRAWTSPPTRQEHTPIREAATHELAPAPDVVVAIDELRCLTECRCEEAYTSRGRHARECAAEYREDVDTLAAALDVR